mmetsp:Transcript_44970/g.106805  ORF Transcript_44970/g.106805 Transcript_44970/m.106805 type:complete len:251 (-) Transcript_44970:500-1252(-)
MTQVRQVYNQLLDGQLVNLLWAFCSLQLHTNCLQGLLVSRHICGKHHVYDSSAQSRCRRHSTKLVRQEVHTPFVHELEACGNMVVFKHRLVVVPQCKRILGFHQEVIVHCWMTHIMHSSSENSKQNIDLCHEVFHRGSKIAPQIVHDRSHISSVCSVVVGVFSIEVPQRLHVAQSSRQFTLAKLAPVLLLPYRVEDENQRPHWLFLQSEYIDTSPGADVHFTHRIFCHTHTGDHRRTSRRGPITDSGFQV